MKEKLKQNINVLILIIVLLIFIRGCKTNSKIEELMIKVERIDSINKKCFTQDEITKAFGTESAKLLNASKQSNTTYNVIVPKK